MIRSWLIAPVVHAAWVLLVACLLSNSLVGVAVVHAADAKDTKDKHSSKDHKDHPESKDSPFKGNVDTALWSLLVFLVLLGVLSKFAWGPISNSLESRERNLRLAEEEARRAREEAETVRNSLDSLKTKANEEARQIRDEARKAAEKSASDEIARARAELQAERERLLREVETDRDQALQNIWQQASSLATLISAKAVGRALNEDDHRRLLDEALRDFRQAAQDRTRDIISVRS